MSANVSAHILVRGLVQGVGFRWFVRAEAVRLGLVGTVANLRDGQVEIRVEGNRSTIDDFIATLKLGNGYSRVDKIKTFFGDDIGRYRDFQIKLTGF